MTQYDETNRFKIWPNRHKEKDTDADFTGELDVMGKKFWVNAWKRREGANPKAPSLSGMVKPKGEQVVSTKPLKEEMDDEIPF